MDPFEWELIRDRDGLTKVKIIGEKENDRNIDRDEPLNEEDILKIESLISLKNWVSPRMKKFLLNQKPLMKERQ
jgi:hypothetical protein